MSRGFQLLVYVFFSFAAAHGFDVSAYAGKPIPSGKDAPTEAKWNDELFAHRLTELERGEVQGIPLEDTLAKARKLIGR